MRLPLLLLLLAPGLAVGLRVLGVFPLPAHSHFAMFKVRVNTPCLRVLF